MNDPKQPCHQLIRGSMRDEQRIITDLINRGVTQPQLLLWQYDSPAISMGCSQRPDESQIQRAAWAGLTIMRRGSGGGAVLVGPWMLSVTLLIPQEHSLGAFNLIEIFGWLEQIWLKALLASGVDCQGVDKVRIDQSKAISKGQGVDWACYASLSHGEIISPDGRKLVGLAQIRKQKTIALVSGLHLGPCDWAVLSEVVVDDPGQSAVLESLNSHVAELSARPIGQLLPQIIHLLLQELPEGFEILKGVPDK